MTRAEVTEIVHNFNTTEDIGFTSVEQALLLMQHFDGINMERYYNAMFCNTMAVVNGITRTYHCDIITAIMCGIEDRDMTYFEWD